MKKALGLSWIVFLLSSSFCYAKKPVDLGQLVITPSRIEEGIEEADRKVEVITQKDIEESGAKDISEVLSGIDSVNISNYGGLGALKTIRMRGATASQVLILRDGTPLNSPRDGEVDLSTIPLDNIERIEVMPGAASSIYGSQAMGGTVNIITKSPPASGQKTEAASRFGSFRTFIETLSQGARVGKLGYIISGGYESSEGFRANSSFNSKDFNAKFNYKLNDSNTIVADCGFYKNRAGAPGSITFPDNDDIQAHLKNYINLNWDSRIDETTGLYAKLYNNYDRLEFMSNSADSIFETTPFSKAIHTTKVEGLDLRFDKELFNFYQLIAGYNYVRNLNDSTNAAKHKYAVNAGYLENRFNLNDKAKLSLSGRLDDYSNFGTEFNPSINFLYNLWGNSDIHTSVSRSFRAPTFNDLYWSDNFMRSNPNLKPEKGITYELGFDTKVNQYFSSGLTYFRNDFNDLINWTPIGPLPSDPWQVQNIGRAVINGAELVNKFYPFDNFEIGLNYAFLSARDKKTNKYLNYQPKNKMDFSLKYKEFHGFDFELVGNWTGQRFHDDANTVKVKPYFLLGFNVSKKIKENYTVFFSLDNLLNKEYQIVKDYPTPGLSVNGGVKVEF